MKNKLIVKHKPIELNNYNHEFIDSDLAKIKFNKICIAVYNNAEFSTEFAYVLAKNNKTKKILVIDSDAMSPAVAFSLGLKKTINDNVKTTLETKSSFNLAMDCISKGNCSNELLYKICVKFKPNMLVLTGNDKIDNYEYYDAKSFETLLSMCKQLFDVVIVNTNPNIYDEFLVRTFMFSDVILVPCIANLINIRKLNAYLTFLQSKQNIDINKSQFISFNYQKNINVSVLTMKNITQNHFIGVINYDKKRIKYRNYINKSYCIHIPKAIEKQYLLVMKLIKINNER